MGFFRRNDDVPERWRRFLDRPFPSAAEEAALFQRVRAGDEAAIGLLTEAYTRLIVNIAKTYRKPAVRHGLEWDDLVKRGIVGLTGAIGRFDPAKGYRFSTDATHRVRQAIGRAIDDRSGEPRPPDLLAELLKQVDEARERLRRESGREPTIEELAALLGVRPRALQGIVEGRDDLEGR